MSKVDYMRFAIEQALRAGDVMRQYAGSAATWKGGNTPVTEADRIINDQFIKAVQQTYPCEHDVVGEELGYQANDHAVGSIHSGPAEKAWVLDPIDGTLPFMLGMGISTFAAALTDCGKPIAAVIYNPFTHELFAAEEGKGATLNGNPIHVSAASELKGQVFNTDGFIGKNGDLSGLPAKLCARGAKALRLYSSCYAAGLVAAGRLIGVTYGQEKPWDAAAAALIVTEAGGRVTDLYGRKQRYDGPINGAIFSNGVIHDKLLRLVKRTLQETRR